VLVDVCLEPAAAEMGEGLAIGLTTEDFGDELLDDGVGHLPQVLL
jgi:hypothetical protein